MKKLYVLLGTLLSCVVVGCSTDLNDQLLAETISTLNGTTSAIEQVTKTLTDATADAKKASKPLAIDKIARATDESKQLKELAARLQRIKGQTQFNRENISKEQKEELAKKHKGSFQKSVSDLDAAQKKLDAALREAELAADSDGKQGLEKLREQLKEAQDEFEVLTKHQT